MQEALIKRLRADTELAALVGSHSKRGRPMIDWGTRPNDPALPAIVMYKVSPGVTYDQDKPTALEGPRVQFSIIGETYAAATLVFRRLRALLENGETVDDVVFERAFLDAERDLNPRDIDGGGTEHLLGADFIIWHRRAEPE